MRSKLNTIDPTATQEDVDRQGDHWCFRPGLSIDIKFGMPKYDCRFHGICKLDLNESDLQPATTLPYGRGKGWLFIPRATHCLLCFDKYSLTNVTRDTHFFRDYFELPEAVAFSDTLNQRIGRQCSLQPGRYRIQDKGRVYSVLFGMIWIPGNPIMGNPHP